ncbi:MAG: nicotinate (nicotinamide) nucleotide adenylyltransferase [Oscillospiraceae bacterium]|jgi:nicotinate-nucleotide adenylyltransferase|nr:nicotinate (nicotinamide) nucleotide adenylyltransferase [Oscillospiraceae bacterium]
MTADVGLFGGTFDPPHLGHVRLLETAARALAPVRILVMPAGRPPHKGRPRTPPEERFAMARLAFAKLSGVTVSDWEISRAEVSYTADTLRKLRATLSSGRLWLIVGADMFLTLPAWRRPEEIFALARVAVMIRAAGQERAVTETAAFLAHRFDAAVDIVPHTPVEISSSELRARLARGEGAELLPDGVFDYIRARGLYACQTT